MNHTQTNRTLRRTGAALAGAVVLAVVPSGVAAAHQCMVENRSEQGEQALGKSPMWLSEDMATPEAYAFTFAVLGVSDPTPEMLDRAVELHLEQDLQRWVSFFEGHTLLTNPHTGAPTPAADKHAADGQGVSHWFENDLGTAMMAIAAQVADESGL